MLQRLCSDEMFHCSLQPGLPQTCLTEQLCFDGSKTFRCQWMAPNVQYWPMWFVFTQQSDCSTNHVLSGQTQLVHEIKAVDKIYAGGKGGGLTSLSSPFPSRFVPSLLLPGPFPPLPFPLLFLPQIQLGGLGECCNLPRFGPGRSLAADWRIYGSQNAPRGNISGRLCAVQMAVLLFCWFVERKKSKHLRGV